MGRGNIHSTSGSIYLPAVVILAPKNLFPSGSDFSFPVCSNRHLERSLCFPLVIPGASCERNYWLDVY